MPSLARLSKRFRAADTNGPESIDRWSVGVGRRHPVTISKASFKHCR